MQCFLTSKHGVHYGIPRVYSRRISQTCLNDDEQTLNVLQLVLSSKLFSVLKSTRSHTPGLTLSRVRLVCKTMQGSCIALLAFLFFLGALNLLFYKFFEVR